MACSITVHQPTGEEGSAGQGLTTLTVSGTATDCNQVLVSVSQSQPTSYTTPQKTVSVVNGNWTVDFATALGDFPLGAFRCGNDNKYGINVGCTEHTDCQVHSLHNGQTINCDDCPHVHFIITPGDCHNGLRNVHIRAEVETQVNAFYTWFFGVDQDNQLGEDSQSGDWLPAPNADGVRVVETSFYYALTGNDPQTITVKLRTSSGPDSECIATGTFVLEPCSCNLSVSLAITDSNGEPPPAGNCLPPDTYSVKVSNPAISGATYTWFVNETPDYNQSGPELNVQLTAGESKTVHVVMSKGECIAITDISLAGCLDCENFQADLRIFSGDNTDVTDAECLEAGRYAAVASPSGQGVSYKWFINGVEDNTQAGNQYSFTIEAGVEKSILVQIAQGECHDEFERIVRACEDCSNFSAELQVRNANNDIVTTSNCLPAGDYSVEAISPGDPAASLEWQLNNTIAGENGQSIQVTVAEGVPQIVTLKAAQGACASEQTVALFACGRRTEFIPCILFKLLALLGLGVALIGAILLACPLVAQPIPVQIAMSIGGVLLVGGLLLLTLGLVLWMLLCRPNRCDWLTLLWQSLILLGLILVYAGLCPMCSWMGLGAIFLFLGILLLLYWRRSCRPTVCRVLADLITLFLFAVNITAVLAIALFWCAITTNTIAGVIWGLAIAGIQIWLWYQANQAGCINS